MQINKHSSFYLRNGWPTKIIDAIPGNPYIFSPANELAAVDSLGVGRVMVKAMRYWAYTTGNEQLEAALKGLCDKKIIKYSGAYKRYDFFEASIFDVEGLIKEGTRQVQDKAVIDTLNEHFIDFVLYPNRYNREYKINRIFLSTSKSMTIMGTLSLKKYGQ